MERLITCPACKGEKVMHGFGCPGFKPMTLPCFRCKGEGSVPKEMLKWIEHGEKLRKARLDLHRSLREEAKLRSVKGSEWSAIEFGKVYNLDWIPIKIFP